VYLSLCRTRRSGVGECTSLDGTNAPMVLNEEMVSQFSTVCSEEDLVDVPSANESVDGMHASLYSAKSADLSPQTHLVNDADGAGADEFQLAVSCVCLPRSFQNISTEVEHTIIPLSSGMGTTILPLENALTIP